MDKGAHFYKADFQIHSPRDALWVGDGITKWPKGKPVSLEERLLFARRFISKCRELEIRAVGITDHHDVCFIQYFQVAAQEDKTGNPVPNPSLQNPIIFPGIEINIQRLCQAIILLDADADTTLHAMLLQALNIGNLHSDTEPSGPEIIPLAFENFAALEKTLNEYSSGALKGRFVILPHVGKEGSHRTLLRQGYYPEYTSMPCVGGYIEHDLAEHNQMYILEGKVREYGYKSLGLFQTTDSRREDFAELGRRNTWVKFSVPTAEALRQACLARQSRIKQTQPTLPSVYIKKVTVSDSIFLGPIELEFNPQFNALIGGRGTGKTSILEYIRYAMQDQPSIIDEPSLHDEISEKRGNIIRGTLLQCNGVVTIHWIKNNVSHKVCFDSQVGKPTLAIEDGEPEEVTPEQLRTILSIQAYSQKQLSTVGTRTKELQRFIEQPIHDELARCNNEIDDKRKYIEQIYSRLIDLKEKNKSLSALKTELKSIQAQANAIEQSLPHLSPELQKALTENPVRLREKQIIEIIREDIRSVETVLDQAIKTTSELPRDIHVDETTPQQSLISNIRKNASELIKKVSDGLKTIQTILSKDIFGVDQEIAKWELGQNEHRELYKRATEKASEHKQKLDQIEKLRIQEANIQRKISELENQVKDLDNVSKEFDKSWNLWTSIHRKRGDMLEQACRTLTEKSGGEIVVEIQRGGDIEKALGVLNDALKGCGIRDQNWTGLKDTILRTNPADIWMKIMKEIRVLAEITEDEIPSDGTVPEIQSWSLTPSMRKNIVERLKPQQWLDVSLTSLEDLPVFYYKPRDSGQRIEFKNASAGQQATALLKVLLKEISGPLIIDQPEEDLDNEIIRDIAEEIWTAKEGRQIIFASHNANIVVNGDAELVIWCAYRETGDSTKGCIAGQGAIDIPEIRKVITNVMEGGKKAFELRKEKYGF